MKRLFTIPTLLMLSLPGLFAQPYTRTYVSTTGADTDSCGQRTSPCATFQIATLKTSPGGEIDALDAGDFGQVFIQGPVTIDGGPGVATISSVSGLYCPVLAALCMETGFDSRSVILRNLTINMATISGNYSGIYISGPEAVYMENVHVNGANSYCVENFGSPLIIHNSSFTGCGASGIYSVGSSPVSLENVVIANSFIGLNVAAGNSLLFAPGSSASLTIRNSNLSNNTIGASVISGAAPAVLTIDSTLIYKNGTGISATSGGVAQISNVTVTGNGTGLTTGSGGAIVSFVNNRINNNTANGAPTSSVYMK